MPKKRPVPEEGSDEPSARIPLKTDISSVEEETIKRVDRTLTTIEEFLSRWDSSKIKPDEILPQITKVKEFHRELSSWKRDAVRAHGQDNEDERVKRLYDFVLLCRSYS
jgi:hypothetical protein